METIIKVIVAVLVGGTLIVVIHDSLLYINNTLNEIRDALEKNNKEPK